MAPSRSPHRYQLLDSSSPKNEPATEGGDVELPVKNKMKRTKSEDPESFHDNDADGHPLLDDNGADLHSEQVYPRTYPQRTWVSIHSRALE